MAQGHNSELVAKLEELIKKNANIRDERMVCDDYDNGDTFSADLIADMGDGFQLWLGSLEDALRLKSLHIHGINGILNCALEEAMGDLSASQTVFNTRSRCVARGLSGIEDTEDGPLGMDTEQVRNLVEFDRSWYESMLKYDFRFQGFSAADREGYSIQQHFSESSEFLKQCRRENRKVLVHCMMGINRSAAAMVAFMCEDMGLDLITAVDMVSQRRGYILTNRSFVEQLVLQYGQGIKVFNDPQSQSSTRCCNFWKPKKDLE